MCVCVNMYVCIVPIKEELHTCKHNSIKQRSLWKPAVLQIVEYLLVHNSAHCNSLQHTATHCITLQHTATHCNTLQHTLKVGHSADYSHLLMTFYNLQPYQIRKRALYIRKRALYIHTRVLQIRKRVFFASEQVLQMIQHLLIIVCTLFFKIRFCEIYIVLSDTESTLFGKIPFCSTLQHTVTTATHCNTLQHTATHCNTLQHTATSHTNVMKNLYI